MATPWTKTSTAISPDTTLTQPTIGANKNTPPSHSVNIDVKTLLGDVIVFYAYLTLLALLLLAVAYIKGVLPLATGEDVLQLLAFGLLIISGFLAQYMAARSSTNCVWDILPFWLWQWLLLWGLPRDVIWHALTTYSLCVVVLLAFLMLIHMWLMVVVSKAIHYPTKTHQPIVDSF